MEFPVRRDARRLYRLDGRLFSSRGTAVFDSFHAARVLAERINRVRLEAGAPGSTVQAGQLNALGLIEEVLRFVVGLYEETRSPGASRRAVEWLRRRARGGTIDALHRAFAAEFPPAAVERGALSIDAWLAGETEGVPHSRIVQEEALMLWLANENPAYGPFRDLFDDEALERTTDYLAAIAGTRAFFATLPGFGPNDQDLVEMLRSPALASPHSLYGQLEYIWKQWRYLLGRYESLHKIQSSLDLIKEEETPRFAGPGPAKVYDFAHLATEPDRFSPDRDWMPRLVLIAKNAYVWLDQLSKSYGRAIERIDQIPDAELEMLARRGISGLWLIGLWERSKASRKIKELRGNRDAVASAYSIREYAIAEDLGGDRALVDLKERAWRRGIRLASDMVPNHMGIDSKWVIDHPERFLSLDHSPFPSYTFGGPDLSSEPGVGIHLEDHYYDSSDAAVVFKRVDRRSGAEAYIYHGNDGTTMPWNDTAQLDYMNPEVRAAVIRTILDVARRFPVVRFDAAMTLTKRHFQRLWFPEPGTGGAIPSRAEHGLTKEQFDARMPAEFWREVVDCVAEEAPDTLLLAEAFWLMEGYFVRSLGMHRVYNSAFMVMLRDEDNAGYRSVIKNTLEFDPEILKRYVNFMNNPDEKTAVEQFGAGDKYFGVCAMLATLPGLPMLGHGQVEGFTEKYGMEFRRALRDETPDPGLVDRHEREIFPLLHRRHLFSGVENFLLYDFLTPAGTVDEDVFAYSNRTGDERALVVYLNRFGSTRGSIRLSVPYAAKGPEGQRSEARRTLGDGLDLRRDDSSYVTCRDQVSGLEYVRSSLDLHEKGFALELGPYGRHVFMDFREVRDDARRRYARLAAHLAGRGVASLEESRKELFLAPIHRALEDALARNALEPLTGARGTGPATTSDGGRLDDLWAKAARLLEEAREYTGNAGVDDRILAAQVRGRLGALLAMAVREGDPPVAGPLSLLAWILVRGLAKAVTPPGPPESYARALEDLLLDSVLASSLRRAGLDEAEAGSRARLILLLARHGDRIEEPHPDETSARDLVDALLLDERARSFLGINRHEGVLWFHKEAFDELLSWIQLVAALVTAADSGALGEEASEALAARHALVGRLRAAELRSGYRVDALLDSLSSRVATDVSAPGGGSGEAGAGTAAGAPSARESLAGNGRRVRAGRRRRPTRSAAKPKTESSEGPRKD